MGEEEGLDLLGLQCDFFFLLKLYRIFLLIVKKSCRRYLHLVFSLVVFYNLFKSIEVPA